MSDGPARSPEDHEDWVRDEPTVDGAMVWDRSPYRHIVEYMDGSQRFPLGWCPECQKWEQRDVWAPNLHRTYHQASDGPHPSGFHTLLDVMPPNIGEPRA